VRTTDGRLRRLGHSEAIAAAVDDLLDREQGDQHAGQRDRGIERRNRRIRGQPKAAEAAEEIDVAEIDQAARNSENDEARRDLDDEPRRAVHRFGESGEVEVVVAPRRRRGAGENSIDEQGRRHLLEPQPGMADRPRHDVERNRQAEAGQRQPAEHHQDHLKRVEGAPFQMTLPVEHELFGDCHGADECRGCPCALS
jgi:hypothetical protein